MDHQKVDKDVLAWVKMKYIFTCEKWWCFCAYYSVNPLGTVAFAACVCLHHVHLHCHGAPICSTLNTHVHGDQGTHSQYLVGSLF